MKISIDNYASNINTLNTYKLWLYDELLPPNSALNFIINQISDADFEIYDKNNDEKIIIHIEQQVSDDATNFFSDLDKPLLIKNEFNISNLTYLNDMVRKSEFYGGDNHIYLFYDSFVHFILLLHLYDLSSLLKDEKFIFILDKKDLKEYYPLDFKKKFGYDYTNISPKQIQLKEIKRLLMLGHIMPCAGHTFLSGIFDYHPNLLTIKGFGLSDFMILYFLILKDTTIAEFEGNFYNKNMPIEIYNMLTYLFSEIEYSLRSKCHVSAPKIETFFQNLKSIFNHDTKYKPDIQEWIIAFYLAYSVSINRDLNSRISPTILFSVHSNMPPKTYSFNNISISNDSINISSLNNNILTKLFKYTYRLDIIRNPIQSCGSIISKNIKSKEINFYDYVTEYVLNALFRYHKDTDFKKHVIVKFEDLKLQTEKTILKICKKFDIPFNKSLYHVTSNGTEFTNYGSNNFDQQPIYKRYHDVLSQLDWFRLEIVIYEFYQYFNYEPFYYDKKTPIPPDEVVLQIFQKPFTFEKYHTSPIQIEKNENSKRRLYKTVAQFLMIRRLLRKGLYHFNFAYMIHPESS